MTKAYVTLNANLVAIAGNAHLTTKTKSYDSAVQSNT